MLPRLDCFSWHQASVARRTASLAVVLPFQLAPKGELRRSRSTEDLLLDPEDPAPVNEWGLWLFEDRSELALPPLDDGGSKVILPLCLRRRPRTAPSWQDSPPPPSHDQ